MFDIQLTLEIIKNFGFPIAVAVWALMRLDKNWAKGETIHASLEEIENALVRIEATLTRNAEIQNEIVTTLKILNAIITTQKYGGDTK